MNYCLESNPIIVAGMHRSGTSWVTSLLSELGFNVGLDCVLADRNNQKGYFEDVDFLALNRKILNSCLEASASSYVDWGWSSSQKIDPSSLVQFEAEACELIKARKNVSAEWGWKDPRNTVLLDFWHRIVPEARYLLIYRYPWEVAHSMQRLGAAVFLNNPSYAFDIWEFYNRQILDFYSRNKNRCLLISSNALSLKEEELSRLVDAKFGLATRLNFNSNKFDPRLFKVTFDLNAVAEINAIAFPRLISLLSELDSVADLPSPNKSAKPSSLRFNRRWDNPGSKPKVSVIIPCYNQGIFLPEALASVESYAPPETEILVANDGSTDIGTLEILNNLASAGYQIINQANIGLAKTRNRLVDLAQAEIVLPLDADNRICPDFIDQGLKKLETEPQISIVYGNRVDFGLRNEAVEVPEFEVRRILKRNFIDTCALVRKCVITDCGGYDFRIHTLEDWELWVHATAKGFKFAKLPFNTFEYRVRPTSMITFIRDPEKEQEIMEYVRQKHWKFYFSWLTARIAQLEGNQSYLQKKHAELELANKLTEKLSVENTTLKFQLQEEKSKLLAQQVSNESLECHVNDVKSKMLIQAEHLKSQSIENLYLTETISKIQSSRSWRVTSPLRKLMSRIRNLKF